MAAAVLTVVDLVEVIYDGLYEGEDEALDLGFAKAIFRSRLEGIREGVRVSSSEGIQLGLEGPPASGLATDESLQRDETQPP